MKTDKNGVTGVRWVREDNHAASFRDMPLPTNGPDNACQQTFHAVQKQFERFGHDGLTDNCEYWEKLNTAELASVDRLINRPDANVMLLDAIDNRVWTATANNRTKWLALMERHCDALRGHTYEDIGNVLSATIRFNTKLQIRRIEVTPSREYNYARLTLSLINSQVPEVFGRLRSEPSDYGVIVCVDSVEIESFAAECDDPERLKRVITAIEAGAQSFATAVIAADRELPVALIDGAL